MAGKGLEGRDGEWTEKGLEGRDGEWTEKGWEGRDGEWIEKGGTMIGLRRVWKGGMSGWEWFGRAGR